MNNTGKHLTTANLAISLAKQKKIIGIIDGDKSFGKIQHYLLMQIEETKSLKRAVESTNKDTAYEFFSQHKRYKNLFILSLADQEDCIQLSSVNKTEAKQLISAVQEKFDHLFIICPESYDHTFTTVALETADQLIQLIQPTKIGIAFYLGRKVLIKRLFKGKIFNVVSNHKNCIPMSQVEKITDEKIHVVLPHSKTAELSCNTADIPVQTGSIRYGDKKYIQGIQTLEALLEGKEEVSKKWFFSKKGGNKTIENSPEN